MADLTPMSRSRPTSMTSQTPASRLDRQALKSSLKNYRSSEAPASPSQSSHRSSVKKPLRPISTSTFPSLRQFKFQTPIWLEDFWASKSGIFILEYWDKWILRNLTKFLVFGLIYVSLIFLVSKGSEITSQRDVEYLSKVLKIAGDFSDTIEDGYIFEQIPWIFDNTGLELQEYYNEHVKEDDQVALPVANLIRALETLDYNWEAFATSRDLAITNVKNQVEASRVIFRGEYERLTEGESTIAQWCRRWWKRALLMEPYEAHFDTKTFLNITGTIDGQISMWRRHTIPDLRHRLTSGKSGSLGGLPGQIQEVKDKWPRRIWEKSKFKRAPVEELIDARGRAVSVLEAADNEYEKLWFALFLVGKERSGKYHLESGFGWWHLRELLGRFDGAVKRLEGAERKVIERRGSRVV